MNANSRSRLRLFFFRTVLVVAPVVAIGLLLEIALRAKDLWVVASFQIDSPPIEERAMVPSRHEGLRVEFNPGYSSGDFSVNEFGMADDAVALERTPGVTRIAVFGDSISGNFRLEPRASSFPTRLEVDLNRLAVEHGSPQRFEVLNFGVNSYSIRESFRMAELRVPRFDPDIVIVQLCWNDSKPTGTHGEFATATFGLRAIDWVLRHIDPERFWAYANVDSHFDAQGWADWSQVFTDFVALSSQRPVFAVLFPYLDPSAYSDWDYDHLHEGLGLRAEQAGLPLLDLRESFEERGLINRKPGEDPVHPGTEGHRAASQLIVDYLLATGTIAFDARPSRLESEPGPSED